MHAHLAPTLFALAALAIAPAAPKKEDATPKVATAHVSDVTATTATVRADVDTRGTVASYAVEWGPTAALGMRTPDAPLAPTPGKQDAGATLQGLAPGTVYHVHVVATNANGSEAGGDAVFTTSASPAPPAAPATGPAAEQDPKGKGTKPPKGSKPTKDTKGATTPAPAPSLLDGPVATPSDAVRGEAVVVGAERGVVKVKVRGTDGYSTLGPGSAVPVGSVVDATRGTVRLTTAVGDGSQDALLRGARFEVRQERGGMTDLVLRGGDFSSCGRTVARSAARGHRNRAPRRSLWAKDAGGRFRTHGRNSVATVRGTEWITTDTCRGTTTRVRSGAVAVRDLRTGRSVLVRAGHSHLARAVRR